MPKCEEGTCNLSALGIAPECKKRCAYDDPAAASDIPVSTTAIVAAFGAGVNLSRQEADNVVGARAAIQQLESALSAARQEIAELREQLAEKTKALSDDAVMDIVINSCDTLDITRVSEMRTGAGAGAWHTTTIFDGDTALLRVVKAAIAGEKK